MSECEGIGLNIPSFVKLLLSVEVSRLRADQDRTVLLDRCAPFGFAGALVVQAA